MKSTLLLAGAHRGAQASRALGHPRMRNRIRDVLVADPVADRASALAMFWQEAGCPLRRRRSLPKQSSRDYGPMGWHSSRSIKPSAIAKVVALGCMIPVRCRSSLERRVRMLRCWGLPERSFQTMDRRESNQVALLGRLATVIPDQTSRAVWGGSVFNQDALATMRRRVSEQSVQEIVSLENNIRLREGSYSFVVRTSFLCAWSGCGTNRPSTRHWRQVFARSIQ